MSIDEKEENVAMEWRGVYIVNLERDKTGDVVVIRSKSISGALVKKMSLSEFEGEGHFAAISHDTLIQEAKELDVALFKDNYFKFECHWCLTPSRDSCLWFNINKVTQHSKNLAPEWYKSKAV